MLWAGWVVATPVVAREPASTAGPGTGGVRGLQAAAERARRPHAPVRPRLTLCILTPETI